MMIQWTVTEDQEKSCCKQIRWRTTDAQSMSCWMKGWECHCSLGEEEEGSTGDRDDLCVGSRS